MPTWSPDGCKITDYGCLDRPPRRTRSRAGDVFAINVDGSNVSSNLTNDPSFDFAPDWQPLGDHHGARDHADRSGCRR